MKKLKLFFIVDNDEPNSAGGGFYAIYKFAEFLALRGHEIFIYGVHNFNWVQPRNNLTLKFRPKISRKINLFAKVDRKISQLSDRFILPKALKKFKPDWVLGVLTYSAIKAEKIGNKQGIPVANFIYECPPWMEEVWDQITIKENDYPFTRNLWAKTKVAYLKSKVLFPNSKLSGSYNSQWLQGKKIAPPIHPGIDPDQMPFDAPAIEHIVLDPKVHHLLFIGRLVTSKNVDLIIQAIPLLKSTVALHIGGTGPEIDQLKKLSSNASNIHFYGFISDENLWSLFRQCRLVLYPSAFEGFGMPPMQSLYFAKPCIVTDLPIFHSIFGDHLEYIPFRNLNALSEKIDWLLENPDYCLRRGEQGRKFILENFTWNRAAQDIEKTLEEAYHG